MPQSFFFFYGISGSQTTTTTKISWLGPNNSVVNYMSERYCCVAFKFKIFHMLLEFAWALGILAHSLGIMSEGEWVGS
jgi:hypothetical protein